MSDPSSPSPAASAEDAGSSAMLATLARIEQRLDALERKVEPVGELAHSGPATVAMVADIVDDAVDRLSARGVDVDQRLHRLAGLVEKLTEPGTLDTLERAVGLVGEVPAQVAMLADTFDGLVARLGENGVDVDHRVQVVWNVMERLTAPEALAMVKEFLAHVGEIQRLLQSGIFGPGAVNVIDRAAGALASMDIDNVRPIGAFGAMRALGNKSLQHSLGVLLEFGRRFGEIQSTSANGNGSGMGSASAQTPHSTKP